MPEVISCPQCDRKLQVPESLLGQDVQCPTCNVQFVASLGGKTSPLSSSGESAPFDSAPPPARPEPHQYQASQSPERGRPPHDDDYDDDYDNEDYDRRRRMRRRDLTPHRGVLVLVMGILGLVLMSCYIGFIFGIVAWVMGNSDIQEIRAGRMDPEGEGLTQAGRICGIIGTIIGLLFCGGFVLYMVVMIGLAARGGM